MEKIFNKLVRDNIPNIIENNNEVAITKILTDEEFKVELLKKLKEECKEVNDSKTSNELLEELADVLEILRTLSMLENKTLEDIINIADEKKQKRGGFDKKIFLEKTYSEVEDDIIDLKKCTTKEIVSLIIDKKITAADLTDAGICPTCFNEQNNHILFGDITDKLLYEDEFFECFLASNPRAIGHTIISTKKHYKDIMETEDEICKNIFVFAKKAMRIIQEVYNAESVYLCTMCDGPMNHFHIQLIPRYSYEKRGSKNFVKERQEYMPDYEKINILRKKLK